MRFDIIECLVNLSSSVIAVFKSEGLIEDRPSAVQIVGQRFREDLILDALEVIEAAVGVLSPRLW